MNGKPVEVPTIDQLLADPGKVQDLPVAVVQHVLIQVTSLLPLLVARSQHAPEKTLEDRLIGIEEAMAILGMSRDHLYRHDFPFKIQAKEGGKLLFSSNGIQRYIKVRLRQG